MRKVLLLMVMGTLVISQFGCRSVEMNSQYMVDDTVRFAGLDQPSALHPRMAVPSDYYSPYR